MGQAASHPETELMRVDPASRTERITLGIDGRVEHLDV